MNDYLHPKVFGLGEEVSPNTDLVRRMNLQKWTESTEPILKVIRDWLNWFKWKHHQLFSRRGNYLKSFETLQIQLSERLQQLWRIAEQPGEDTLRYFKKGHPWNQRSCFGSSDVNITLRHDPDNFVCHLVLKATTRNQQGPFKIYSYKSCEVWCTKSKNVNLKITLNYSVAPMASYHLSPCFLGKFRAQLHLQRWDTVAGKNWRVHIV